VTEMYGVGWRDLVLVGPLGVFPLGDAFEDSGRSARPEAPTTGHGGRSRLVPHAAALAVGFG
jgi:hypothetical protein